ncbi:MAG: M15 family metallopeptidase [Turicibacter sp.]|nr:M15 family metallopeptidase [Turicibacter sp.]
MKHLIQVMAAIVFLAAPPVPNPENYENVQLVDCVDSYQVLVNKQYALSPEDAPKDLRVVQVLDSTRNLNLTIKLRSRAADMAEQLFLAAANEGHELLAVSGYRGYMHQKDLYEYYVHEHGKKEADRFSARPGHSEHQTGLAIDVSCLSLDGKIDNKFGETPEGAWLIENAPRFGFIIRYPQDREAETGFKYEPWHLRYVGIAPALIMQQNNWIFEEYVDHILAKER